MVLTPEPIARPRVESRAEPRVEAEPRNTRMAVNDEPVSGPAVRQRLTIFAERGGRVRGTVVKRWIWRTSAYMRGACRHAGRRITPPARYTVARGDTLWLISEKHYSAGSKYQRIYRANRNQIDDPDLIYPCQRFRIPRG